MNVFGIITKEKNYKSILNKKVICKNWERISFDNSNVHVTICYESHNIRLINNNDILFVSENNIYVRNGNNINSVSDNYIIEKLNNKKELFIKNVLSNINMIFYDKHSNKFSLSSHRASAGRMFYLQVNEEIAFSNNFTLLVNYKQNIELSPEAIFSYLKYMAIPEDMTFDLQIKSVPVSHYAIISLDDFSIEYKNFFQLKHLKNKISEFDESLLDDIENNLQIIMKTFSDERIHMLISGGIDSSLIAFYLKGYNSNIIGHFCRFGENDPEQIHAEKVAVKLGIPLKIYTISDDIIIKEIENTARNTTFPHGDFSSISVNFLLRKIRENYGPDSIIIEYNGADDGFGYASLNKIHIWKKIFQLPSFILYFISNIIKKTNIWMFDSKFTRKLMYFYRAKEKNLFSAYVSSSAGEMVFKKVKRMNKSVAKDYFLTYFQKLIEIENPSFYEKMNIAQFFHINSRLWTAKAYTPSSQMGLRTIFPFTWSNILEIQAKVPLQMKLNHGIIKWPLKKLLEKHIDKQFIYRKKSGFAPPLISWLEKAENYSYFHNTIMRGELIKYLNENKISRIFKLIKSGRKISTYAINLIWELLFFEVWFNSNFK